MEVSHGSKWEAKAPLERHPFLSPFLRRTGRDFLSLLTGSAVLLWLCFFFLGGGRGDMSFVNVMLCPIPRLIFLSLSSSHVISAMNHGMLKYSVN